MLFRLAVQNKVVLVALENVNAGNVVGLPAKKDCAIRRNVRAVCDLKQNGFIRLRRHSVNLIPGKLPKYKELIDFSERGLLTPADRGLLHREARALALSRLEDAARTLEDFNEIIDWWDKLDANRERMERAHEIGRTDEELLTWGASEYYLPPDASYDMVLWKMVSDSNRS